MYRILILQETPGELLELQASLSAYHELIFVRRIDEALEVLGQTAIDLIISRVHLEQACVFEFIKQVKQNPQFCQVPILCFCGKQTAASYLLDSVVSRTTELLGADKYLSLSDFCCDEYLDCEGLRREIESCLET